MSTSLKYSVLLFNGSHATFWASSGLFWRTNIDPLRDTATFGTIFTWIICILFAFPANWTWTITFVLQLTLLLLHQTWSFLRNVLVTPRRNMCALLSLTLFFFVIWYTTCDGVVFASCSIFLSHLLFIAFSTISDIFFKGFFLDPSWNTLSSPTRPFCTHMTLNYYPASFSHLIQLDVCENICGRDISNISFSFFNGLLLCLEDVNAFIR